MASVGKRPLRKQLRCVLYQCDKGTVKIHTVHLLLKVTSVINFCYATTPVVTLSIKMLPWKKDSVDISHDMPTFHVRYLGTTETFISNGKGCTTQPLQRLWDNAPSEKNLRKVTIAFSVSGIYMNELESKHGEERSTKSFNMEDISFCSADKSVNDRLFCWISKNPLTGKLEAHAVLCSTCEKAQSMSSVLSRAFQLAYKDWTADKQRQKRRKSTISVTLLDASSESGPVSPPHGRFMSSTRRSSDHSVSIVPPAEDYKNRRKLSD